MRQRNKRYIVGIFMIIFQYILFRAYFSTMKLGVSLRNITFFIYIFLYLKEDIYSFKSCLIWEELRKQLKCYFEWIVLTTIIIYHLKGLDEIWKYHLIGTIALIYSIIIAKIIRKIFYKQLKKNLIIVGTGNSAKDFSEIIAKNRFTMYELRGYLHVDKVFSEEKFIREKEILGSYDEAKDILKDNQIDEIIVALPDLSDKEMNMIINKVEGKVTKIKFIPKINKMYTFNPQIQDYDGVMLISAKNYMLSKKRIFLKRTMDILGAIVGLIFLFPLYLIYGRKIKTDGGTAVYSHNRIGKNLKAFKMHKFRSMYIDAEERLQKMLAEDEELRNEYYKNFKLKDDPRITPVGEFLRKTSLDEFPQFINVLKGEMSLVGPRPVVQKEVDMYYGTEMGKKVFQAKPGITGMWQAHGRSDIEDYDERIALDLYYIRNWSIWLDIIILIKTVKNVLGRKGAY